MKALDKLKEKRSEILAKLNSDELLIEQINPLMQELNNINSHIGVLESIPAKIEAAKDDLLS